jgi:hypothetical protein
MRLKAFSLPCEVRQDQCFGPGETLSQFKYLLTSIPLSFSFYRLQAQFTSQTNQ